MLEQSIFVIRPAVLSSSCGVTSGASGGTYTVNCTDWDLLLHKTNTISCKDFSSVLRVSVSSANEAYGKM